MRTPLLPILLGALAATGIANAQDHRPIAFTNARIITVSGDTIERGTLVVRHGKIEAVGADVAPPAGARLIDASGKTIMPGLVCASSDAGLTSAQPRGAPSPRSRGRRGSPMPTRGSSNRPQNEAATRVVDGLYPRQKVFGELLEAGVTSLVLTPQGSAFPGLGAILAPDGKTLDELTANDSAFVQITMARDANTKKLLTDNFAKAKKVVDERKKPKEQPKPAATAKPPTAKPATGAKPAEAEKGKEPPKPEAKPAPKPEAKAPPQQPKQPAAKKDPNIELLADLLEGKQRALVTMSSAADLLHWQNAVDDDIKFTRTLIMSRHDPFSGTVDMVLDELKKLECAVLLPPTMTTKGRSQHLIHPAKMLHEAGIEVGFLTGDNPAQVRVLFFQLMEQVRCGLPADTALKGVTLVPAKALGIDKSAGSLEVGKDANLMVFTGDPLSPEGELDSVWFRGRAHGQQP